MTLLNHLLKRFNGDQRLALAAWYQGEKAVRERRALRRDEGLRRQRARARRPPALERGRFLELLSRYVCGGTGGGAGVRWSLDGLFASPDDARAHAERAARGRASLSRSAGAAAWPTSTARSLAEALAELGDLRAARQEAEYYHYLAESTDSENAEIRDLGAWLEPRLTEIANVIRAFELEWIGLPADTADRLLGVAGGRRTRRML